MARNCIVIDLDQCIGCFGCEAACKALNNVDLGVRYNKVQVMGPFGSFPEISQYWLPTMCQQCENPACIDVCPTGASRRDEETGIVTIDAENCIGCQACLSACPYGVRTLNNNLGVVQKCTLCADRLAAGEQPACVVNCATGTRFFGDLDDPESDVSKVLAAAAPESIHKLNNDAGTNPLVSYILSEKIAVWQDNKGL